MSQMMTVLKDVFTQFWEERKERERQYIVIAVVILIFLLIYLVAIEPAMTGRQELNKLMPTLRQQATEMKQMAQELQALPRAENPDEVTRSLVDISLSKDGLKAQSLSVIDGVVRVQFSSTSMAVLQSWLLEMQRSFGLFVEEIKITALDEGLVSASLTLRQSINGR
jgi:general secretion pathway protein M